MFAQTFRSIFVRERLSQTICSKKRSTRSIRFCISASRQTPKFELLVHIMYVAISSQDLQNWTRCSRVMYALSLRARASFCRPPSEGRPLFSKLVYSSNALRRAVCLVVGGRLHAAVAFGSAGICRWSLLHSADWLFRFAPRGRRREDYVPELMCLHGTRCVAVMQHRCCSTREKQSVRNGSGSCSGLISRETRQRETSQRPYSRERLRFSKKTRI